MRFLGGGIASAESVEGDAMEGMAEWRVGGIAVTSPEDMLGGVGTVGMAEESGGKPRWCSFIQRQRQDR